MSLPATDREQKRGSTVIDLIGNTPLLRLKRFEDGLHNVELIMSVTLVIVVFAAAVSSLLLYIDHRLHRRA